MVTNQTDPLSNSKETSGYVKRQRRLETILTQAGLDAVVLNPGPSLIYLSGMHFHLMERPVLALFIPGQPVTLVVAQLEAAKTKYLPYEVQVFLYGEDPNSWPDVFHGAVEAAGLTGKVGVEPTQLRFLELRLLEAAAPRARFVSAETSLETLRMSKDSEELDRMRTAVQIAETALLKTIPSIQTGVSERQIAAELSQQLLQAGSDPEFPFSPIVSSGPNSANPHASPSDRTLTSGDLLVIDWGAYYKGYCSDLTRTFAVGKVKEEYLKIAEIVKQANEAGRAAVAPGVSAGSIDDAARKVIIQAGYGDYFTHRTGHGLGMQGHEAPYIRAGNAMILEPGMTFTVEPGIYLPERNGVRIEDNIVVTENGSTTLSTLPRELIVLGS